MRGRYHPTEQEQHIAALCLVGGVLIFILMVL
jgi:hypothetical protein